MSVEKLPIGGEEPENKTTSHIGPQHARLHRGTGIEGQGLKTKT